MARRNHTQMFPSEWRAGVTLSGMYVLCMLGMFLVLPVLLLYAASLPGVEDNKTLVGMAISIYGSTQAALQLPLGIASDKFGCKKVTYVGLIVFAAGSFLAAATDSLHMLVVARAVQGAGAVSVTVMTPLADLTHDEVRTHAMAMIGLSIDLTFSISLVLAPVIADSIGVPGLLMLAGALTVSSIAVVAWTTPNPEVPKLHEDTQTQPSRMGEVLENCQPLTLDFSIFTLHAAQVALSTALSFASENLGPVKIRHWKVYLPSIATGLIVMVLLITVDEARGKLKQAFVLGIACIALVQAGLLFGPHSVWLITGYLIVYFIGFNASEANLPSMVLKIAPLGLKGTTMGVYNALQSVGLSVGGASGGLLFQYYGFASIFTFCCVLMGVWLLIAPCSPAPSPVKNTSMLVGTQWCGNTDLLFRALSELDGVESVASSADRQTVYIKALQKGFDQKATEKIISGV